MSALQAEVFEAFRAIDVPEDKALKPATALASAFTKSEDETARGLGQRDDAIDKLSHAVDALNERLSSEMAALNERISSQVAALNERISAEVAALNAKIVKLEGDVGLLKWMVGFSLAMLVTLLFRSFTH